MRYKEGYTYQKVYDKVGMIRMNKRIVFITGTRADYGKLKSLISVIEASDDFEAFVFVSGMHLLAAFGDTYKDILKDGYRNIYMAKDIGLSEKMDISLANTIKSFSSYISRIEPDLIVVHGDRIDALAGAIVGMLNNVRVAHIEGGEVTGTVDESMRHAISKMVHSHFTANEESKIRLIQLGEQEKNIFVIGSPDIDIMLSDSLPNIEDVKKKYNIDYNSFAILIYHPVTTEWDKIKKNAREVIKATQESNRNYIVIYPNNDFGSELIIEQLKGIQANTRFKTFPSLPLEDFLILLKSSDFIIGNSSAGIRESCVYGVPAIDIGTRQRNRYPKGVLANIIHSEENAVSIKRCIEQVDNYRYKSNYYGTGKSAEIFIKILRGRKIFKQNIQKCFVDLDATQQAIENYINEVCF